VTALDAGHVEVVFNEAVTRSTAEDTDNYTIVVATLRGSARGNNAAGGGISVVAASLKSDNKTVDLSTQPMSVINYNLLISGVKDTHGNTISEGVSKGFTGSTDADNTDPELVYRKPGPGATNVGTASLIELTFSEPIQVNSLEAEFQLNSPPAVVNVTFYSTDNTHFSGAHDPLAVNTDYNIVVGGVLDLSGNPSPDYNWTFHTSAAVDNTPPTLVSSSPANLATNVPLSSNLVLTFSEAVDPNSFTPFFSPDLPGTAEWSIDARTLTFTPESGLAADTQYELEIFPGDVKDLSGNGNTQLFNVVFTTAASLQGGSIAGTISGDPNSTAAADPTGALVAMADGFPFAGGDVNVFGATNVAGNNTYTSRYLHDGTYYPLCIKNTHNDGELDPFLGDAIGLYGIDLAIGDQTPLTVDIVSGNDATGIDFPIYDPSAVYGRIDYEGQHSAESHTLYVGLFETAGFDPNTSTPVAFADLSWPLDQFYVINSIDAGGIANGNYYVGAYLDANDSGDFEPLNDPAGLFGGNPPTAINLSNGSDAANKNFPIQDALPGLRAGSVHWKSTPHAKWLKNLSDVVREAGLAAK
jgi:hypothetical protein